MPDDPLLHLGQNSFLHYLHVLPCPSVDRKRSYLWCIFIWEYLGEFVIMCVCAILFYSIVFHLSSSHRLHLIDGCYQPMDSMATIVRISSVHLYVSEQMRVLLIIGSTGNSAMRLPVLWKNICQCELIFWINLERYSCTSHNNTLRWRVQYHRVTSMARCIQQLMMNKILGKKMKVT